MSWDGFMNMHVLLLRTELYFSRGPLLFFNALMVAEFLNGAPNMCCLG